MRITLEYDAQSGQITDKNGIMAGCYMGLQSFDEDKKISKITDILKLKDAGFTVEEITALSSRDLI